MPPSPQDLIAYSAGSIVIGEVVSVDDREVIVRNRHGDQAHVALADVLAVYPRPGMASLKATCDRYEATLSKAAEHMQRLASLPDGTFAERVGALVDELVSTRSKNADLHAEAAKARAALESAGVRGPAPLSYLVAALVTKCDVYARQATTAHNALNACSCKTAGNLDERVAFVVKMWNGMVNMDFVRRGHELIDSVMGIAPNGSKLDERVAQLVEKYRAMESENKALREKTAWTIVDMGVVYAKAPPKPETIITIPAGGSVRIVVEKP